jgi:elongation factor P hydroxylase
MHTAALTGIDLLIARGPDLDAVVQAVESIANIERAALKLPGEADDKMIEILDHASWAAIHIYSGGDFGFKVDLYGRNTHDYQAIAQQFAEQLQVLVAWPDERTMAMTAFIACEPNGTQYDVACDDCEPDGLTFRRLPTKLTRGDVDHIFANALWLQPHSATQRSDVFVRALNNDLDFDLRAVDDAILDAVRDLGERGVPMNHADLQFNLRRYYPPIVPTLMRRMLGRDVTATDLFFTEIADAIWKAVPIEHKTGPGGTT